MADDTSIHKVPHTDLSDLKSDTTDITLNPPLRLKIGQNFSGGYYFFPNPAIFLAGGFYFFPNPADFRPVFSTLFNHFLVDFPL